MVLTLEGDGEARGLAHGQLARELIAEAADRWMLDAGDGREDLLVAPVRWCGRST